MSREFLIHNGKLTSDLDADGNLIKNLPGVAHLVDGKVPSDELPAYVDDVLEYATRSSFPATGERGKIYIALDTNKTYRWSGTQYTEIARPTLDDTVTPSSKNGVKSSGIWSALWGALASLPTGFSSLYDWCVAQLAGKASTADATLAERGFSEWGILNAPLTQAQKEALYSESSEAAANDYAVTIKDGVKLYVGNYYVAELILSNDGLSLTFKTGSTEALYIWGPVGATVATRTALQGYQLGSQSGKPLASEAEAEALRAGKQDALTAQQLANIAAVPDKLDKSGGTFDTTTISLNSDGVGVIDTDSGTNARLSPSEDFLHYYDDLNGVRDFRAPHTSGTLALAAPTVAAAGNLAALDASGNPTDSTIPAASVAVKGNIPYALVAKTISNGAVTLDDRAINAVAVSSSLASLTVNFPTATSGKARDFGLRLTVASGITTAPELALPQGVVCENADGEAPEIGADGAATILYFTETASGVFLVKGEVLQTITQA